MSFHLLAGVFLNDVYPILFSNKKVGCPLQFVQQIEAQLFGIGGGLIHKCDVKYVKLPPLTFSTLCSILPLVNPSVWQTCRV